jgi:hypothetical protein
VIVGGEITHLVYHLRRCASQLPVALEHLLELAPDIL